MTVLHDIDILRKFYGLIFPIQVGVTYFIPYVFYSTVHFSEDAKTVILKSCISVLFYVEKII